MREPPAFVLVHGAWHGGWCWAPVARRLQAAGHRVFAPSLTGLADRAHLFARSVNLATHVQDITALIESESLDGCVLVGHSYAGNVISGVADHLRERLGHLVYLDAVVPDHHAPQWRWADFNTPEERARREAAIDGPGLGLCLPPPPAEFFGIADPQILELVRARMTPMPAGTYRDPIAFRRGGSDGLPRTYIGVTDPPFASMAPMYRMASSDPTWRWRALATCHDAMLTAPDDLVRLLREVA